MYADDLAHEEREARRKHRLNERLQRAAARRRERDRRNRLIELVRDTGKRYPGCTCRGLHGNLTDEDLKRLGAGCTATRIGREIGYVCPRLDAIRRGMNL